MRGGYDTVERVKFLRSLEVEPTPEWVAADGDHAIANAVKQVWPDAELARDERRLGRVARSLKRLMPLEGSETSPIYGSSDGCRATSERNTANAFGSRSRSPSMWSGESTSSG